MYEELHMKDHNSLISWHQKKMKKSPTLAHTKTQDQKIIKLEPATYLDQIDAGMTSP
jgi:hypothetical protein